MTVERFIGATIVLVALAQATTAPKKGGNPEAAKIKNPVASSPESIAAGRRGYQRLCTRCHGSQGKGDGGAAGARPSRPRRAGVGGRASRRGSFSVEPRRESRRAVSGDWRRL